MVRSHLLLTLLLLVILFVVGCAAKKPILERGWIGGCYEDLSSRNVFARWAPPDDPALAGRKHAVYVRDVYSGTPAEECGLLPGDLILSIAGVEVESVSSLRSIVDTAEPGTHLAVTLLRYGEVMERTLVVGSERYRKWRTLSFGLGLSSKLDFIPNPDFNLLGLVSFQKSDDRLELHSPHEMLLHEAPRAATSDKGPRVRSTEGFHLWLGIVGVGKDLEILSQEKHSPSG